MCRHKGTLAVGQAVAQASDRELCSSFEVGQTENSSYVCIPGNKRTMPDTTRMTSEAAVNVCAFESVWNNQTFGPGSDWSNSYCGYGTLSAAFCGMGRGDPEFLDALPQIQQFWQGNYSCHYLSWPGDCADVYAQYLAGGDAKNVISTFVSHMWLTASADRYAMV